MEEFSRKMVREVIGWGLRIQIDMLGIVVNLQKAGMIPSHSRKLLRIPQREDLINMRLPMTILDQNFRIWIEFPVLLFPRLQTFANVMKVWLNLKLPTKTLPSKIFVINDGRDESFRLNDWMT